MKSKYLYSQVQKWQWRKRIIRWLYSKYINEPYFPKGKIEFFIIPKSENIHRKIHEIRIHYKPKKFVPGMLEDFFWEREDCEIKFWE